MWFLFYFFTVWENFCPHFTVSKRASRCWRKTTACWLTCTTHGQRMQQRNWPIGAENTRPAANRRSGRGNGRHAPWEKLLVHEWMKIPKSWLLEDPVTGTEELNPRVDQTDVFQQPSTPPSTTEHSVLCGVKLFDRPSSQWEMQEKQLYLRSVRVTQVLKTMN